jgi:hypothetical protein
MRAVEQLAPTAGIAPACQALGVPRSSYYRAHQPQVTPAPRPAPARALAPQERAEVRAVLNGPRFQDAAPREVYATLLDEGRYLCHWRTMYRLLESPTPRSGNAAGSCSIRPTPGPSCWPPGRTNSGAGTGAR